MLRATTDVFTWVLMGAIIIAFVVWYLRARPSIKWAAPVAVVAAIVLVLMRVWDAKFWGVVIMGGAVIILLFLPWLDKSPVKSIRYRPGWHKAMYILFAISFIVLGYLGTQPPTETRNLISQIGTIYYFAFFLAMPIWSGIGKFKPVPDRVVFAAH
jgi:ubiquinol-cytochrome c reductase cytochrome b subunit